MQTTRTLVLACLLVGPGLNAALVCSQDNPAANVKSVESAWNESPDSEPVEMPQISSVQRSAESPGESPAESSAESPVKESANEVFRKNRIAFQQERMRLETAAQRLDQQLMQKAQTLDMLTQKKAALLKLHAEQSEESSSRLASVTRALETGVATFLSPLRVYGSASAGDVNRGNTLGNGMLNAIRSSANYISFILPLTIVLALVFVRFVHPHVYAKHRIYLHRTALLLICIFPLSSMAQTRDPDSQRMQPHQDRSLAELLGEARGMLGLSTVQKYIRLLSASENEGRRLRISDVELDASPLDYFDSVVVGSGEYHSTLAALYLADNNASAALRQLRPLADADTRFATRLTAPERYESLLRKAILYLFDAEDPVLAREILELRIGDFQSSENFEVLYPRLLEEGFGTTANGLAAHYIAQTTEAAELVQYARILQASGSPGDAINALNKALTTVASAHVLESIVDLSLSQNAITTVNDAIDLAPLHIADLASVFRMAEQLSSAGWRAESLRLLDRVIERTGTQPLAIVAGETRSTLDALKYLSVESFRGGFFSAAEAAALAAIKPLSSAERRALVMAVPESAVDRTRVPDPDRLVAPLYFGLIYEKQGRLQAAKDRFAAESQLVMESLVDSKGLYMPEMFNHLALLGSVLSSDANAEPALVGRLDTVLSRLEQQRLEALGAVTAEQTNSLESRLVQLDAQIALATAEIDRLEQNLVEAGVVSTAFGALLLMARNVAMLIVVLAALSAAVILALRYATQQSAQRTARFFWKFTESLGWLWVLSIASAPLGLVVVVAAQYFLRNQASNAEWTRLKRQVEGKTERKAEDPVETEVDDWENVIQMLRATRNAEAG